MACEGAVVVAALALPQSASPAIGTINAVMRFM